MCFSTTEKVNPQNRILEENMRLEGDTLTVNKLPEPLFFADIVDTNSMDMLFDKGNNLILTGNPDAIAKTKIGDIVVYFNGDKNIIHQLVSSKIDKAGEVYFRAKGINNHSKDPYKVYLKDIRYVVLGILW